jgi:hypothetical protein
VGVDSGGSFRVGEAKSWIKAWAVSAITVGICSVGIKVGGFVLGAVSVQPAKQAERRIIRVIGKRGFEVKMTESCFLAKLGVRNPEVFLNRSS